MNGLEIADEHPEASARVAEAIANAKTRFIAAGVSAEQADSAIQKLMEAAQADLNSGPITYTNRAARRARAKAERKNA